MQIAFSSKALRDTCADETKCAKQFGVEAARLLRRRLADLRAAESIDELPVGNVQQCSDPRGAISIELCDGYRIILQANHAKNPIHSNGDIDWSAVDRIKLFSVTQCDG